MNQESSLDEKAFAALVSRQRDLLWHLCSTYRFSAAWETEDALQEVLCVLWHDFGSFDHRSSERTWVFRVATNMLISLKRRRSNQPQPDGPAPVEESGSDEGLFHLQQLIETLDDRDYQLVKAHLYGFSHAEIAHMTGSTTAAVAMRLSRIKKKLKKQYGHEE